MKTIFKVKDMEFHIDNETGDLIIKSEEDSEKILFEEGMELLKSLRDEQLKVLERKEMENGNWLTKLLKS